MELSKRTKERVRKGLEDAANTLARLFELSLNAQLRAATLAVAEHLDDLRAFATDAPTPSLNGQRSEHQPTTSTPLGPTLAEEAVELAKQASGSVHETMELVRGEVNESTFTTYRRKASMVMGYLTTEIMLPIWNGYPELMPPEMLEDDGLEDDNP